MRHRRFEKLFYFLIIGIFCFFVFSFFTNKVFAAYPATTISPSDNIIDPVATYGAGCTPGSANCYVDVSAGSLGTSASTTNFSSSNATNTNSTSTNLFSTFLTTLTELVTNLTATNSTTTNSTSTNVFSNFLTTVNATIQNLTLSGALIDTTGSSGTVGQILSSTGTSTQWINQTLSSNIYSTSTNIVSSSTIINASTTNLLASSTNIFSNGTTTLSQNVLTIYASSTNISGTTTISNLVLNNLTGALVSNSGVVSSVATGSLTISAGAANVATSGSGYVLGGNLNFTIGTGNFTAPSNPEITIGGGANSVLGAGVTITIPDANSTTRGLVTIGAQNFSGTKTFVNGFNSSATSTMSAVLSMNSNLITNLATPINGTDAVNKSYVDSAVVSGVATTSVISLASGVATTTHAIGDRYLLQAGNSGFSSCVTNNIAQWSGASWFCNVAATGTSLLVSNTGYTYQFNGSSWVQTSGAISVAQLTGKQGGDGSNYYFLGQSDYNNLTSGSAQLAQLLTTGTPHFTGLNVSGTTTLNNIAYSFPATQASNTVLSTNGSGVLSWITALTANLATGAMFVGNGAGQAAAVNLSGDATLNSTGVLTLANSGVAANTYGSSTTTQIHKLWISKQKTISKYRFLLYTKKYT